MNITLTGVTNAANLSLVLVKGAYRRNFPAAVGDTAGCGQALQGFILERHALCVKFGKNVNDLFITRLQ